MSCKLPAYQKLFPIIFGGGGNPALPINRPHLDPLYCPPKMFPIYPHCAGTTNFWWQLTAGEVGYYCNSISMIYHLSQMFYNQWKYIYRIGFAYFLPYFLSQDCKMAYMEQKSQQSCLKISKWGMRLGFCAFLKN